MPSCITQLAGGGSGYFADQSGAPRLLLGDNPWALIPNAGRWGGTWQSDLDGYCDNRDGQGFTAIYLDPLALTAPAVTAVPPPPPSVSRGSSARLAETHRAAR